MAARRGDPFELIRKLTSVGAALSAEKDNGRLMELILESARELTNADGGTLYSRTEGDELRFEIMLTGSLGIRLGGTSGSPIDLPPVPLHAADGSPNDKMVAARAATSLQTVNIPDAYSARGFDFSGTRAFDEHDQQLVESLASQAAIALTNKRLIDDQRRLFEAFIELIAAAIDDKSPYTGGHCRRVPELTMMLADAAAEVDFGPLKDFSMSDADRYELKIAGWLHDCGKVTTPEYVVDKGTKLETIYDRVHELDTRFELVKRDLEIAYLRERLAGAPEDGEVVAALAGQLAGVDDDREFIRQCNVGGEFMPEERRERVRRIARRRVRGLDAEERDLLSDDEVYNLTIEKGTLTAEERQIINHHIVATIKMLESLPYPAHLERVPEFAGGHHERMDGRGYPRGLTREQMSVQARVMGIADIFEALTAADRPYKKAMSLSVALTILGRMKEDNHVDPDLFDVFVREKVYLRYAERFLDREQIDEVDESKIPGYRPLSAEAAS